MLWQAYTSCWMFDRMYLNRGSIRAVLGLTAIFFFGWPSAVLAVCCRDRQRSVARFHEALAELQRSPLLPQAGVTVTAPEDTPASELMAVATAAVTAVATIQQHMQQHGDGSDWHGRLVIIPACV